MMTDLNKGGPAMFFTPIPCVHSLFALQTQTFFSSLLNSQLWDVTLKFILPSVLVL